MWSAVALSVVVVAYNNVINRWRPFQGAAYVPVNLAFAGIITAIAAGGLGVAWNDLVPRGDIKGAVAPLLLVAVFAIGAFAVALSRHAPRIADKRVAGLRGAALAYYVLVRIPLGTGVVEEVVFRGVLFAVWRDAATSVAVAALCTSVAFGLWHISPTVIGLRMNDPRASKAKVQAAVMGAILLTTVAGLGLMWLRVASEGLAGPILLHAGINSVGALAAVVASAASAWRTPSRS